MKNKSFEERIFDTQELIKDVIAASDLNIAVIELIMRNLYFEVKQLAEKNLRERIKETAEKADEDSENGDSTGI